MSESSRNTAAKTLKNPYRLQTVTFKLFLKGKKTKIRKKKKNERSIFSGFGNGNRGSMFSQLAKRSTRLLVSGITSSLGP